MGSNKDLGSRGESMFTSSMNGLANVIAVLASFLGTPWLFDVTIDWLHEYTARAYGYGFETPVSIVWFLACSLLIFFTARATVSTALVMGGAALLTRFM